MQRKQGKLESEADHDESEPCVNRSQLGNLGQACRKIHHIEGPGPRVDQSHADQEKGCANGAHDQVLVGRGQSLAFPAHADQGIG